MALSRNSHINTSTSSINNMICLDCGACTKKITDRSFMICSTCKCNYDLICAKVSNTRFYMMDPERKKSWTCFACIHKKQENTPQQTHNINEDISNITLRKPRSQRQRCLSLENLSLCSDTLDDTFEDATYYPTPFGSSENTSNPQQEVMKKEIEELTSHLVKSKEEINKLLIENKELKLTIQKLEKEKQKDKQLKLPQESKRSYNDTILDISNMNDTLLPLTSPSPHLGTLLPVHSPAMKLPKKIYNTQNSYNKPKSKSYRDCLVTSPVINNDQIKYNLNLQNKTNKQKAIPRSSFDNCDEVSTGSIPKIAERIRYDERPTIMICGDQQCKDLSPLLIKLRQKHKNTKNYRIVNYSYPDASADHILKSVQNNVKSLNEEDWLVLCLGSNDSNPTQFMIELSAILQGLTKPQIIVTSVSLNPYLNEDKLNYNIKMIAHNRKNCRYLYVTPKNNTAPSKFYFSKCINYTINMRDYEDHYLGKRIIKPCNSKILNRHSLIRGTIPYFFNKITAKNQKNQRKSTEITEIDVLKPGTIPFYFKKQNSQSSILGNTSQQFFRAY